MVFVEPLVPLLIVRASEDERVAFAGMVNAYTEALEKGLPADGFLEAFVETYPNSRWRPALEYNLGRIRFDEGYYTRAIQRYTTAYELSRSDKETRTKALSDRALAVRAGVMPRLVNKESLHSPPKDGFDAFIASWLEIDQESGEKCGAFREGVMPSYWQTRNRVQCAKAKNGTFTPREKRSTRETWSSEIPRNRPPLRCRRSRDRPLAGTGKNHLPQP